MLKALAIVVILLLAYTSTVAYSLSSGRLITVQTDSSYYHIGDVLFISGRATFNDGPVQSRDVAISLMLSTGTDKYYPTGPITTDSNGQYNAIFTFPIIAKLGAYIVKVSVVIADVTCLNQTTVQLTDTIYIKASGDIDAPAEAPISRNGDIYSLTGNISSHSADGIVIERNNVILNGMGFTLNGKGLANSNGIYLTRVSNVTIENMSIESFHNGVDQDYCSHCHIINTNLFSNSNGIYCLQASSSTIEGNNITKNVYAGILLDGSYDNSISGNSLANTISSNFGAISLRGSSYGNNIVNNNFANNTLYGVYIEASYSNRIFHNNFLNNTSQGFITPDSSGNVWDNGYPSGGNYWSDYAGADVNSGPNQNLTGSDNIGDTAYTINSKTKDNYPLMNAWNPTETNITINGTQYSITIITNATITQFDSTPNNLNFTATGAPGSKGYLLIIVPKGVNTTELKVLVNGTELTTPLPLISENGTHYFIYCELSFSTLQITVFFVVPVTPLGTLAATISMISILGVYVKLRKRKL